MKKAFRKTLASILVAVMVLTAAPLSGFVGLKLNINLDFNPKANAEEGTLASTGQYGDDVYWTFDSETGLLIISGSGEMTNYSWGCLPFYSNSSIKSVVIDNGITSIDDFVFCDCTGLTNIEIPNSVTSIGSDAFCGCTGLTNITFPDGVTYI